MTGAAAVIAHARSRAIRASVSGLPSALVATSAVQRAVSADFAQLCKQRNQRSASATLRDSLALVQRRRQVEQREVAQGFVALRAGVLTPSGRDDIDSHAAILDSARALLVCGIVAGLAMRIDQATKDSAPSDEGDKRSCSVPSCLWRPSFMPSEGDGMGSVAIVMKPEARCPSTRL